MGVAYLEEEKCFKLTYGSRNTLHPHPQLTTMNLELELEIFIFHRKWLKIYIIEKLLSHESDFCIKVMYYSIGN